MRDPAVIQMDAWQRARDDKAFRDRAAADDERLNFTEAELDNLQRLIDRYRLTEGVTR